MIEIIEKEDIKIRIIDKNNYLVYNCIRSVLV